MSGTRVTVELPDELHQRLTEVSRRSGEPIDAMIPRLLARALVSSPALSTLIEAGSGGGPALLDAQESARRRLARPVLDPPLSQSVIEGREDRF